MGYREARPWPGLWSGTALAEKPSLDPGFSYRKAFMSLSTVLKGGPTSGGGASISLAIKLILSRGCSFQWPYSEWGLSVVGEMEKIRLEA